MTTHIWQPWNTTKDWQPECWRRLQCGPFDHPLSSQKAQKSIKISWMGSSRTVRQQQSQTHPNCRKMSKLCYWRMSPRGMNHGFSSKMSKEKNICVSSGISPKWKPKEVHCKNGMWCVWWNRSEIIHWEIGIPPITNGICCWWNDDEPGLKRQTAVQYQQRRLSGSIWPHSRCYRDEMTAQKEPYRAPPR